MPHEIDGTRAIYARKPAWHRIGHVKEDGWFTSEEALAVLDPTKEPIRRGRALVEVIETVRDETTGEVSERVSLVDDPTSRGIVRKNPDTGQFQVLSFMSQNYGVIQIADQFAFLDEVVAAYRKNGIDAYYETAGLLRGGKQVFVTIDMGALTLDPNGRADIVKKYMFGSNSYDGSWAFRVKMTNLRVECANIAAAALRGSNDKVVDGDWSTRHTQNVMDRVEEAKQVLGLAARYEQEFERQAEYMIQTDMSDDTLTRLLSGLFTAPDKNGTEELDREAVGDVRTLYELSPTCANVHGTVWGGLQSVIEYVDWKTKVRGGKSTSMEEARLRRQMGETDKGFKQEAWDKFWTTAQDVRPKLVSV